MGSLSVNNLIQQSINFDQVIEKYYDQLDQLSYANIIAYPQHVQLNKEPIIRIKSDEENQSPVQVGIIGAGQFSAAVILPYLKSAGARLIGICSSRAHSGQLARKYGFQKQFADPDALINDPDINMIVIANRHASHASLVVKCLEARKKVYVEKPLCLNREELDLIMKTYHADSFLAVGYNRRFSAYIQKIKRIIKGFEGQLSINYVINAGFIDPNHWVHDPQIGGGRILGELCHFIDLCNYLTQSTVVHVNSISMGTGSLTSDSVSVQLKYQNGSMATIQYLSQGSKKLEKEYIQLFFANKVLELQNFKKLNGYGLTSTAAFFQSQDKGYAAQFKELIDPNSNYYNSHYFEQVCHVSKLCFDILDQLQGRIQ